MSHEDPIQFFSSKPRLVHMSANIALCPALLYLVGFWPWPPTLPHYITFAITGLIAMRYARQRWHAPRLIVKAEGIYCGEFYPWESIRNLQTVMRALKLTLIKDDGTIKDKVINLGWASNDDFKIIVQEIDIRYQNHQSKD